MTVYFIHVYYYYSEEELYTYYSPDPNPIINMIKYVYIEETKIQYKNCSDEEQCDGQ